MAEEQEHTPERNIKRRKVFGHWWADKLEDMERQARDLKAAALNSIANGKPLDNAMLIEIINKAEYIENNARELRKYDGGNDQ